MWVLRGENLSVLFSVSYRGERVVKSLNLELSGLRSLIKRKGTGEELGDLSLHPSSSRDSLKKFGAALPSLYLHPHKEEMNAEEPKISSQL